MALVYTIGHSTRPLEEFLELLHAHGVELLVDVRRFPGSRRNPQYGSAELEQALASVSIDYVHEPELGGRRAGTSDGTASPNTHWRDAGFRGYADHMATGAFAEALERLRRRAAERQCVVMCAEAVPWRCHRQLIADALVAAGDDVAHIIGPGKARPHALNPAARAGVDGRLVYPGEPGRGGLAEEQRTRRGVVTREK